jgi:phosphoenolpyruvate synthase/pyruvate phosphate dikinase
MIVKHFSDVVNYDDLLHLRVNEVIDLLSGRFFPKDFVGGRNSFVLKIEADGVKLLTGVKQQKEEEKATVSEIKGTVAYPGKVKGRAKVVLRPAESYKIKKGDVLIATMSTPDFLPAMQKAAAFVTDIGGITSHAAIVSREMKKPCIIGTKIATKVFKDGDLVEVDANTGVVRKL